MRKILGPAVLCLGLSMAQGQTAESPVNVTVTVVDPSGAVVTNARVEITEAVQPKPPAITAETSGRSGEAQFSLVPGRYDCDVRSQGFRISHQSLEIGPASQRIRIVLQLSAYSGPDYFHMPGLPLIPSEPLTEMIPVVDVGLKLQARQWPRKWKRTK